MRTTGVTLVAGLAVIDKENRMTRTAKKVAVLMATLVALGSTAEALALADPNVPGFTVETYASWDDPVGGPTGLAFDDSTGALYVGRDDHGTGCLKILRIPPGGTPVLGLPVANYEYGERCVSDPDAVIFDALGTFYGAGGPGTGIPGSVVVGCGYPGRVWSISPVDPHPVSLLWDCPPLTNPHKMALDNTGRLFISDETAQKLYVSDGGCPTDFATGLPFNGIAIDTANRVFAGTVDGKIRIYDPNGIVIDPEFVIGLQAGSSALAFGRGGCWGTDLYTISGDELLAIDSGGSVTVLGTGFATAFDIAFGVDQAMYSSMLEDRILRIVCEPRLVSSEPPVDGTLPRVVNNCVLLTFCGPITLPPGPALSIAPLGGGMDLGEWFTYSQPDGVTLKAKEGGAILVNRTWYRIRRAGGFNVQPFILDVCTLQGDADNSGRVLAADYFYIKNCLVNPHPPELVDPRCDLDGNGQVLAGDYFVVKNHMGNAKPPKP
jgi:hypothetical protein